MKNRSLTVPRRLVLSLTCCLLAAAGPTVRAQRGASAPSAVIQVRTALAHGDVAAARRAAAGTGQSAELAMALVEIFTGQFDEARARLEPLAEANPLGDAALEIGLLDLRRGRREEADQRLQRLAAVRTFNSPDDYFRLARAAEGIREYLLANDAYVRVTDEPRADIQTAWGDLFLLRHQAGDAATSYRDALAADPQWIPAMIGLARALVLENRDAAVEQFEQARSVADEHPDVLLFEAELGLLDEEIEEARAALDRLAEVRPGTVEEAAFRVAIAYEEGGLAAVEPAMAAVRAADPTSALGYRRAAEQASRNFLFDQAADLARRGTLLDPADPYVHAELGLQLLRTGDEPGARAALERSWDLDMSAQVTKNLLDLLDTLDTFTVIETDRMTFKFHPDEADVLAPYAIPLAEEAYDTFVTRYGMTPSDPILIEVFNRHDDFAVRTMGLPGLGFALGASFGRIVTMDSPRVSPAGPFSWHATLWHELAHVFSLQVSGYQVPRWLTEGISVFEEHRKVPAWGRELTLDFARLVATDQTFGVKGLPDAFKDPHRLAAAYFEASLVVEHLVEEHGDAGLRTLLRAYADGASDEEAFTRAFGQSIDAVDASFATFVAERYGALSRAMAPPSPVDPDDLGALKARAAAQPDNYESQLALGQALFGDGTGDLNAAIGPLERAAELAPQASGSASPRALLAQIAVAQGDIPAARRHLRALLEFDHANVVAARTLRDLSADAPDDLDVALRLIADLDPQDGDVHGQLGRRLMDRDAFADALVEFEAALAVGPANLAEAHTDVAEAQLRLGRREEAKQAALRALMEAPTFARAQDLLLEAIGRQ